MKTPKQKAKEIFNRFDLTVLDNDNEISHTAEESKQCALICVDEIIKAFNFPTYTGDPNQEFLGDHVYWLDVKREIEEI